MADISFAVIERSIQSSMAKYSSALLLALSALVVPSGTHAICTDAQVANNQDIVSIVCSDANDDRFGTLCDLLRETDIDETLTTSGNFFLFAPTNTGFTRAGRRVGITRAQKQNTLKYHISSDASDLECGERRDSLLFINGVQQSSLTRCDDDDLQGQEGNANLPTPGSSYPRFVDEGDNFIDACNGQIAEIGDVMGWGTPVYNYGIAYGQPCSFYDTNCAKASKGGYAYTTTENNGLVFTNVYAGKSAKKGYGRWSNLNRWQSIYANNALYAYDPYFQPYYQGKYGKKAKKGYNRYYGGFYNNANYYYGGYYNYPPGYGKYGKYGRRGYWHRNLGEDEAAANGEGGYLRGAARNQEDSYEPIEYEHY